jgi:hypothetical protein
MTKSPVGDGSGRDYHPPPNPWSKAFRGVAVAVVMFVALGTLAALWSNPLFMRMTPVSGFEIALLLLQSILAGVYVGLPSNQCGQRTAGFGAIIGFLGIACPVCNKVLVLLVGTTMLLEYFEPMRLYVALGGVALLAVAVWLKSQHRQCAQKLPVARSSR